MPRLDSIDLIVLVIALTILGGTLLAPRLEDAGLIDLPEESICLSQRVFGIECPGCGLTRSTMAMGRLDLRGAVALNWLTPAIFLLALAHLIVRTMKMATGTPRSLRTFDLASLVTIAILFVVRTIAFYLT
jgi:hypothetical protein